MAAETRRSRAGLTSLPAMMDFLYYRQQIESFYCLEEFSAVFYPETCFGVSSRWYKDRGQRCPHTCPVPLSIWVSPSGARALLEGMGQGASGLVDERTLLLHLRHCRVTEHRFKIYIYIYIYTHTYIRAVHPPCPPPSFSLLPASRTPVSQPLHT